jgi:4-hydroxymandelate oxidase
VLPLLADQAAAARRRLPAQVREYVEAGAGDELSLREAEAAWRRFRLRPRVLRDVAGVDTSLTLLGTRLATPVLVAPTAFHRRLHPGGEAETSRGAAAAGSLMVVATRSDGPVEDVTAPFWWQAYVLKDRALTRELALRARDAGASAVVVTGDTPYLGPRRGGLRQPLREQEQDPAATLDVVGWLTGETGLPVLVKGVLRGDDAVACLDAGAAGVVVSNHGGRQLDRVVTTAAALPDVVCAVAGRAPVLVDGGVRSGIDALCALALGANAVLVGRPVLWALAANGSDGVRDCLTALTTDLRDALALAGCARLADVEPDLVTVPTGP